MDICEGTGDLVTMCKGPWRLVDMGEGQGEVRLDSAWNKLLEVFESCDSIFQEFNSYFIFKLKFSDFFGLLFIF